MAGIEHHTTDITRLLVRWRQGDAGARELLIPLVHAELHRMARQHMAGERPGHVLQATALVNEVYLRLVDLRQVNWTDRVHFLSMSARLMRRVLVDFARARRAQKRGGAQPPVSLDPELQVTDEADAGVLALNDALEALEQFDERKSQVVELRFFAGLSVQQTATVLNVSPDTVMRDWRLAKAWLSRELGQTPRTSLP